jgi:glycine cleavage system aminomethyltransferase T
MLRGLRVQGDALPITGAPAFEKGKSGFTEAQIGIVTSSTLSPMLSAAPIAFAMLKTAKADLNSTVLVEAETAHVEARVTELRFWPPKA